jgi:hypothetical protein
VTPESIDGSRTKNDVFPELSDAWTEHAEHLIVPRGAVVVGRVCLTPQLLPTPIIL